MPETKTTAAPRRTRAAATKTTAAKTTAKAAPAKAAAPAAPAEDGEALAKYPFTMEHSGDTKSYAKFSPPKESGCVGSLYVPLGTTEVKVLLVGPADVIDPE